MCLIVSVSYLLVLVQTKLFLIIFKIIINYAFLFHYCSDLNYVCLITVDLGGGGGPGVRPSPKINPALAVKSEN